MFEVKFKEVKVILEMMFFVHIETLTLSLSLYT